MGYTRQTARSTREDAERWPNATQANRALLGERSEIRGWTSSEEAQPLVFILNHSASHGSVAAASSSWCGTTSTATTARDFRSYFLGNHLADLYFHLLFNLNRYANRVSLGLFFRYAVVGRNRVRAGLFLRHHHAIGNLLASLLLHHFADVVLTSTGLLTALLHADSAGLFLWHHHAVGNFFACLLWYHFADVVLTSTSLLSALLHVYHTSASLLTAQLYGVVAGTLFLACLANLHGASASLLTTLVYAHGTSTLLLTGQADRCRCKAPLR